MTHPYGKVWTSGGVGTRIGHERKIEEATRIINNNVEPNVPNINAKEVVTDLTYYMDGYLRSNLDEVPKFLAKDFDCVIVVSGSAMVRLGKSTIAQHCGYYVAFLLNEQRKKKGLVPQDNPVPFNVNNIVFSPDDLMKKSEALPKNSVIIYDEASNATDSASAMSAINKGLTQWFTEAGQYNHVIILVLPDFFKLSEMIAVPRSLFLINTYMDKEFNRGYFSFYNFKQKELLYILGRKKYGSFAKYQAVQPSFRGRFTKYSTINETDYREAKRKALKKKAVGRLEVKWGRERDAAFWLMNQKANWTVERIAKEIESVTKFPISGGIVKSVIGKVNKLLDSAYISNEDIEEKPPE